MWPSDIVFPFRRPRDEIEEESYHNEQPHAGALQKKSQYQISNPHINLETTKAEIAVLEQLAKRKGYSYVKQETPSVNLPSTMNAYYKSEWHAAKKKQQEMMQIDAMNHANGKLVNSSNIPYHLIPSYTNMLNYTNKSMEESHMESIYSLYFQQMKEQDRQLQITNEKRKKEEIEQKLKLQEKKRQLALEEQRKMVVDEKKIKEKISQYQERLQKEAERKIKEKRDLEEQKRRDKEALIEKQKMHMQRKNDDYSVSKQIDELLARRVREQYRPPKEPEPPVSREEFDKAQREKAEREAAIRISKQKAEQLHRDEVKRKTDLAKKELEYATLKKMATSTLTPELNEARRKSDLASQQLDILFKNEEELYKTQIDLPSIYIILLCFNESVILPHTIAHYRKQFPSCQIIIYDNESSDDSVMIAKELGCHVVSWSSNNINDESLKIKIRNKCWNHIKEGWIIMADMDEWIYITEEELKEEEEKGTTILSIEGLEMVGESQTLDFSDIDLNEIKKYIPFSDESKNLCFFRNMITSMNYGPGSHKCKPEGIVVFSSTVYQLRHMCNLGLLFLLNKMKRRYERSALNRSKGMSIHYTNDENAIIKKYNKLLSDSISL